MLILGVHLKHRGVLLIIDSSHFLHEILSDLSLLASNEVIVILVFFLTIVDQMGLIIKKYDILNEAYMKLQSVLFL